MKHPLLALKSGETHETNLSAGKSEKTDINKDAYNYYMYSQSICLNSSLIERSTGTSYNTEKRGCSSYFLHITLFAKLDTALNWPNILPTVKLKSHSIPTSFS